MRLTADGPRLMLSNPSGARTSPLDATDPGATLNGVWSPDGQHVALWPYDIWMLGGFDRP